MKGIFKARRTYGNWDYPIGNSEYFINRRIYRDTLLVIQVFTPRNYSIWSELGLDL